MKQWLSLLLALSMVFSCALPAFASEVSTEAVSDGETTPPEETGASETADIPETTEDTVLPETTAPVETESEEPVIPEETESQNAQALPEETEETLAEEQLEPAQAVVIAVWTFEDPDELLTEGKLILPGADQENPADFDTVVSMLPSAILSDGQQIPVTWTCPEYEAGKSGTYLFRAALPEGFLLAEDADPLEISVEIPESFASSLNPAQLISIDGIFPDETMTRYLKDHFDRDHNGLFTDDEIALVTKLYFGSYNETDANKGTTFKNIDIFYNLKTILFDEGYVQNMDLSACASLENLELGFCTVDNLNLAGCSKLRILSGGDITNLQLPQGNSLQEMSIYCSMKELDLSHLSNLRVFKNMTLSGGSMESLILPVNGKLQTLICSNNQLNVLDLSRQSKLTSLSCENNCLTALDTRGCPLLKELSCDDNCLRSLTIGSLKDLTYLSCSRNHLEELNISGCPQLQTLYCDDNYLTHLNTRNANSLTDFSSADNKYMVTSKIVPYTSLPQGFSASNIISTDNSGYYDQEKFVMSTERMTYTYDCGNGRTGTCTLIYNDSQEESIPLDQAHFPDPRFREYLSANVDTDGSRELSRQEIFSAEILSLSNMGITDLTGISCFKYLKNLDCSQNALTELDVSGLSHLTELDCIQNQLKTLTVKGLKELSSLAVSHNPMTTLDVADAPALNFLYAMETQLTALDVTHNPQLADLYLGSSQMTSLDLRNNLQLISLMISGCPLKELDLSRNILLRNLNLTETEVSFADLSQLKDLESAVFQKCKLAGVNFHPQAQIYDFTNTESMFVYESEDGTLDLSILKGFDPAKVQNIQGGYIDINHILHPDKLAVPVTYTYDCGAGMTSQFSIAVMEKKITPGWHQAEGGIQYIHKDGSYTKGNFETIDGKVYYFDENGYRISGWKKVLTDDYYFDEDGVMATGWVHIGEKDYYFSGEGKLVRNQWIGSFYVGADGAWDPTVQKPQWKQYKGKWWYRHSDGSCTKNDFERIDYHWYYFDAEGYMVTGWKLAGNHYFYFNSSGIMVTGWQKIGSYWFHFKSSGVMETGWQKIGGKYYYFRSSGAMSVNTWVGDSYVGADGAWNPNMVKSGWKKESNGRWRYYLENGSCAKSWQKIGSYWYFFDAGGYMAISWKTIGSSYYYFDGSGHMVTGWKHIGSKDYYFESSGVMAVNQWIGSYYVGADGAWIPNMVQSGWKKSERGWRYIHSDGSVTKNDFERISYHWYYFDSDGYMVIGWQYSENRMYYFDGNGYMVTGWKQISGSWYHFDSSGAMETGWQKIGGSHYFFTPNGAMAVNTWIGDSYVGSDGAWIPGKTKISSPLQKKELDGKPEAVSVTGA